MSGLPPVAVDFNGNATKGLAAINKMITALDRLSKTAKAAGDSVTAAFEAMEKGAAALESVATAADVAKKAMQGLSRASNAVAKATEKAATATEAGMTSIATATEAMAAVVDTASTAAVDGIAAIGTSSRATAAGLRATAAGSAGAGAAMASSGAKAEGMGAKFLGLGPIFDKVRKWGTLGLLGIGIVAVDLGAKFQAAMTKLSTAAGAPIAQVDKMKSTVLSTAQSVGMSGTEMATALYHPVSAGLSLAASLQAVKYAAEETQISGAKLDDTTYSLSSVMKAFNFSAKDAGPTMAQLNAIVGEGDMRFQDFNSSIKNWAPTAAQMGISVTSMGAGLAYLTDRGNSAEVAATRLTMGISMMTTPSAKATSMLVAMGVASTDVKASSTAMETAMKKGGITQNRLALDLKKPDGLYVALTDLKTSLEKAGVSATEADSIMSKIFGGGRSDKAMMSLLQNLPGLKGKFDAIANDSSMKHFQAAWEKTTKTLSYQWKQIETGAENLGVKIGTALIPQVSKFINLLESKGKPVVAGFSAALSGIASGFDAKTPTAPKASTPSMFGQKASKFVTPVVPPPPPMTAWQKVGQVFKDVTDDLTKFGSQVGTAFKNLLSAAQPTLTFLGTVGLGALKAAGGVLANVLGPALVAVTGFMAHHKTLVEGVAIAYLGLKTVLLAMTLATKGVELATKAAAAAQVLWNAALDANPIGAAIVIIGALALAAMYCWQHFQAFRNVVMDVFSATAIIIGTEIKISIGLLKALADAALGTAATILEGLGHLPGFGWAKSAAKDVLGFKASTDSALDGVVAKVNGVVAWTNKQRIDVVLRGQADDLTKKIADAKKQLSDKNLPPSKQIKLQADIADWQQKLAAAKEQLASTPPGKMAVLTATITNWQQQVDAAKKQLSDKNLPPGKRAVLTAEISDLSKKISSAKAELASVKNKTVYITSMFTVKGAPPSVSKYVAANANGSIRFAADGLVNRNAMMAPAGSNILWAEPETGGESYIPHARSKRTRSRKIAAQTVGILGGQVSWGGGGKGAAGAMASYSTLGAAIPAGVAAGVSGAAGAAHAAVTQLAKGTVDAFSQELGIASPSRKFKSLGAYVITGLVQGLTGSTASVKSATRRIASYMYVDFGSSHKGTQEIVNKDNKALLSLAAKRDSVASKLKAANAKLAAVQKQYAAEQKSVADSIMQSNSIVMAAPDDGSTLTSFDVIGNAQAQMQKTLQFAANLQMAQKNGLSAAMVAQIAASGVDAGGATAAALASATKGQIQQLNSIQTQTQAAANGVGKATADAMYGAGVKSAQGLVNGLKSQEKAIDAQMLKIAKSMQAAIKKALGIKSPSRVFQDLGQYIPQGLAKGINGGTHHATGAVMTMSKAVASAGHQRSYAYAGSHLGGGGYAGAGTTVINVTVEVKGNVTAEKDLAESIRAVLLRKGANNSQTWQSFRR